MWSLPGLEGRPATALDAVATSRTIGSEEDGLRSAQAALPLSLVDIWDCLVTAARARQDSNGDPLLTVRISRQMRA
jgi:hypothetical protein